jgi:hypothetical protein
LVIEIDLFNPIDIDPDMKPSELLARLDERQQRMESMMAEKFEAIITQTTKTNGRVTVLEEDMNDIQNWKSKLGGMWQSLLIIAALLGFSISTGIALWMVFK